MSVDEYGKEDTEQKKLDIREDSIDDCEEENFKLVSSKKSATRNKKSSRGRTPSGQPFSFNFRDIRGFFQKDRNISESESQSSFDHDDESSP